MGYLCLKDPSVWIQLQQSFYSDPNNTLSKVANDWRYLENFCIFESNKSLYLINNHKQYPKKRYPSEFYSWYYKRWLYFRDRNDTSFPPGIPVLDDVYLFMTRGWGGWNNIYHHTEWIHNLLRYVHHASELPQVYLLQIIDFKMHHVAYYPDPMNQNLTFGDPKGHYKWSISYYELAKTAFPPNQMPHFLQGEEYARSGLSFCARRGVHYQWKC